MINITITQIECNIYMYIILCLADIVGYIHIILYFLFKHTYPKFIALILIMVIDITLWN
jgi:hypothetical protein